MAFNLGIYSVEAKASVHKHTGLRIFIASLFVVTET